MNDLERAYAAQLAELKKARSASDVLRILAHERSPEPPKYSTGAGSFSGKEREGHSVRDSLVAAGWDVFWAQSIHAFSAISSDDTSVLTYVSGSVLIGERKPLASKRGGGDRNQCPFTVGDRVYHYGQQWAATIPGGTATVLEIMGPYHDGSYELLVSTGEDFSRSTGPCNPETHQTWWSSLAVRHARTER